ncbi:transcriptional regulator, TetR family [Pseudarthrobacter enclensis]|uniref:HTH tetR-type domain-containing protein n=2 Tax=Pseudarthrobacter enclensis TaxID=993070 RepID=A0A0V8I5G0_9MICC|nr:hypothetical protein AS031_18310 [Pseudarthrobacter enclensis]SCC30132.1 transcriptional regulator, TetR family [Pseudarthrobacter enclensis]
MTLLDERRPDALTVQKLSIERIAREAGVSKTTIYRWWPSKAAVVIDTFLDNHIARTPVREDIPAIEAIQEHLTSIAEVYAGYEGRLISQLIAECQYDPATMAEYKKRFYGHRLQTAIDLIERAMAENSIRSDVSPRLVAELIYAPIYYRLLFADGPLTPEAMKEILRTVLEGISGSGRP